MLVELHILQNFAPSNLNRDDTGAPKDCEFGGYRRARISSQALKRAMRDTFRSRGLLADEHLGRRTKRLIEETARRLVLAGKDEAQAEAAVQSALASVNLSVAADSGADLKTQYLLFLREREIAGVAQACLTHWDVLVGLQTAGAGGERPKAGARDA